MSRNDGHTAQVDAAIRERFGENARAPQPINSRPIAEYTPDG